MPFETTLLPKIRIATVFVTMNRCATARTCLEKLTSQSRLPDRVIVIDNASTDETEQAMKHFAAEHPTLDFQLQCLAKNIGNAGGMAIGLEAAFHDGFDAAWVLDDDSWPEAMALAKLLECTAPADGIRTSMVLAPDSNQPSWPSEFVDRSSNWKNLTDANQVADKDFVEVRRSWLGALITRQAYEKAGQVNGDFFLRGEDEDYPRRLVKVGFRFYMVPKSILRHPLAGSVVSLQFWNYKLWLERDLTDTKLYYRIRNMLWIKRRESGTAISLIVASVYLCILARWFRPILPAVNIFKEAVIDAYTSRLGKRK